MHELDAQGFVQFFKELWDRPPFAWQRELARRVVEDDTPWPEAIALPTAAGKTACLDIAIYALAAQTYQLDSKLARTAPRRIFFVVDRRVIVYEAYERARQLAAKLQSAQTGILRDVADSLRRLAGGGDSPLACFQLRGGMYRSDAWAKNPLQPTIIASTVDQIGSRLLFRAYGRSFKAWPIQAGLVGNDTLILLDEAHCSQPFMETLQAIRRYRGWAKNPLSAPFHSVVMSATTPNTLTDVYYDTSDEPGNPAHPLGRRQLAQKQTRLVPPVKVAAKKGARELAKALAEQAEQLSSGWTAILEAVQPELFSGRTTGAPATVVFCNRVDTAREAHAILNAKHGDNAILLTGRMRPIDKDDTVSGALKLLNADSSESRQLDTPMFVVATQTLEVGANLDFDLLVTECASLDALRQRFGRLNRMGRKICANAAIVIRADQSVSSEDDPVYGEALAKSWLWLQEQAGETGEIDMGIAALQQRLPSDVSELCAPTGHAPVLLPAHLDVLAQTSPEPWPSPDVSLFLHGPRSGPADVQICWRADLVGNDDEAWKEAIILSPPSSPECISVPFGLVRRWLSGENVRQGADVEGVPVEVEPEAGDFVLRRVIRWRGRDEVEIADDHTFIRPGDILVIPVTLGGWDTLATIGKDPVSDWGDRAHAQTRDKALLRLHPDIPRQWPSGLSERFRELAETGTERLDNDPDGLREELCEALALLIESDETPQWLKLIVTGLRNDFMLTPHPTGGLVLRGRQRLNQYMVDADTFCDEDDPSASGTTLSLLDNHLDGVAGLAGRFARGCGLPLDLADIIETAGRAHDLGKADPRFQAWLKGGNPRIHGPLLAKSGNMAQGRKESEAARKRAGYPAGARHELLSVRMLESSAGCLPESEAQRDVLLHLVASHHGYCRPFAPVIDDKTPVTVTLDVQGQQVSASSATGLERLDSGVAERYWRLTRRYGWWGLAWLEAMTRLADHRRSEWEERNNE